MFNKIFSSLILVLFISTSQGQQAALTKESFSTINLDYPGLQLVKKAYDANDYNRAASELLRYYRQKDSSKKPDFSNAEQAIEVGTAISKDMQTMADNSLSHHFKPHKGYGYFDYGQDINWQLWPVKDNEVRWQLHRVKWWTSMALVYQQTKQEKYAKEWMNQFADWAKKNPLGLSADNDKFAWRPLEVSDRVQSLPPTFSIFVNSVAFTPQFLMLFLQSYQQQADYLPTNYADKGNHRLFEAQRVLFAGVSFPEFKNAPTWRKSGIEVLNAEIKKQVYPDGMQFELSPVYHAASIDIFLKAYRTAQKAGMEKEFPESYRQTVENMVMAFINITFPNYNQPMFGDSWLAEKNVRIKQFQSWLQVFPTNEAIRWFASDGQQGHAPQWLSNGLTTAGFYTFRNGWKDPATVMVLKASPPGAFHAQPDNGTFELWVNGRNFTPDAGVFVYSGDAEITKLRESYRQTRMHSTLTLDNQNMLITDAQLDKWETTNDLTILTYSNPSYKGLVHQRSVLFIDQKYFLIIDQAMGDATGVVGTHFVLKEDSQATFDHSKNRVYTNYADGNNLLVQNLNSEKLAFKEEDGKVSYAYRKESSRPLFAFEQQKNNSKPRNFISVLYPYNGHKAPVVELKENVGNDYPNGKINITLKIDGKTRTIATQLKK
ncbi:MAG: heparin-sulfate lyase HepC [Sphingobacterium sp.]